MNSKLKMNYGMLTAWMFLALLIAVLQSVPTQAAETKSVPMNLPVDMNQAIKIATQSGGTLDEIELENENGQWVYEAEVELPRGGEKEILIDAQTGKILKMETETETENENEEEDEDKD